MADRREFMVRCADGKDRSRGMIFNTFTEALQFAEWDHSCTSSADHQIYERIKGNLIWRASNLAAIRQMERARPTA